MNPVATPNDSPRLVPLDDALQHMGGISRQTANRAEKAGHLRFTRIGTRVFISEDEIRRVVLHGLPTPPAARRPGATRG